MKLTDRKLTKVFFSSEIRTGNRNKPVRHQLATIDSEQTRPRYLNKLRKTKARAKPELDPDLPDLEPEGTLH